MRYLGTTDEVDACDCCGKTRLKSTVAIETDDGAVVHYGVTCAARALRVDARVVRSESKRADEEREAAERAAAARESDRRSAEWRAGVQRTFGVEVGSSAWFDLVASLGFPAIRARVTLAA